MLRLETQVRAARRADAGLRAQRALRWTHAVTLSPPQRRRRHQPRVLRQHPGLCSAAPAPSTPPAALRSPRRSARPRACGSPRRATTMSPSRTAAIGPPRDASGAMWPTVNPRVAPEKRPSVMSATESPRPAPTIAAVTAEHLAHARTACWPFVADHDHVAGLIAWRWTASNAASSLSNTRAGPRCMRALGARQLQHRRPPARGCPSRITRPPCGLSGRSIGRTTSWPGVSTARPASSASVRPVTVSALPSMWPDFDEPLDHQRPAAGRVKLGRHEAARRLQVGDQRRAVADAIEVVQRQRRRPLRARSPAGAARRWSTRRSPPRPRSRSRSPGA